MAKTKEKKRGRGRTKRRDLLRAHARRATPTLPPGAQIRIEPRGEPKMSEVLGMFVEPYLGLASTENGQQVLLHLASLAWNAANLAEERRKVLLGDVAEKGLPGFTGRARHELQDLLMDMVERKLALFDENKRWILSIELTGPGRDLLSVISTAADPSADP